MKPNHRDIIKRVEHVRLREGLNKSQFSARIGLKPQTYNNFIGAQGSKPNIDLVMGVIGAFTVSPHWLLFGRGLMRQMNGVSAIADEPDRTPPDDEDRIGALAHAVQQIEARLSLVEDAHDECKVVRLRPVAAQGKEVAG